MSQSVTTTNHPVRFGLRASQHHRSWAQIREAFVAADEWGLESAWVFDHMIPLSDPRTGPNLEGWTLDRGELNAGVWGEGYVDRRHPHTFLHELILSATTSLAGFDASLSAGRGFAPFGTDDPMVRPFVKYPANHHLAQILERWVAIGAEVWTSRSRLLLSAKAAMMVPVTVDKACLLPGAASSNATSI